MATTITIRTDRNLRQELQRRAEADGKSLSEFIREILAAAVEPGPLGARTGHVQGRLRLTRRKAGAWRERIRARNWRA
jgi:plasmid stability protein